MKIVFGVILLVLVGFGAWIIADRSSDEADESMDHTSESMMSDDASSDEMDDDMISGEITFDTDLSVDGEAKVFNVSGKNFEFDTTEIRVQEGDTVVINFSSTDGFHDWMVDEFDAATARVNAGDSSSVTFVADKAGSYEFYCSVGNHRTQGMVGTLIVE